jgi:hypothetical protein
MLNIVLDSMNLQNISVTLTFEEMMCFLDATKCCYEIDMRAKLFQNPSMHDKVTVWTWLLCKWGQTDMSLSHHTLSWYGRHVCQVILKSFHAWPSSAWTWMCIFKLFSREWVPSNYKCDLDLEGRDMGLCRDTWSWCGRHLCLVTCILKSFQAWQSYSPDTNVCTYKL